MKQWQILTEAFSILTGYQGPPADLTRDKFALPDQLINIVATNAVVCGKFFHTESAFSWRLIVHDALHRAATWEDVARVRRFA